MNSPLRLARIPALWNRFFFEPVDAICYAAFRRGYGLLLLAYAANLLPYSVMWFGDSGLLAYDISRELAVDGGWTLFSLFPKSDTVAIAAVVALLVNALGLLAGVFPRFNAASAFILLISLQNRNALILDAEDVLFRVFAFLVIFMPAASSRYCQSDAVQCANEERKLAPGWPLRLVQIEMTIVFAGCAYSKLNSLDWFHGTAMYYVTRLDDYFGRFPVPAIFIESMAAIKALSWLVLSIESFVPVFIWFRETRRAALFVAIAFHLGIEYSMNLFLFQWIMMLGWLSFVTGQEWQLLTGLLRKAGFRACNGRANPSFTEDRQLENGEVIKPIQR